MGTKAYVCSCPILFWLNVNMNLDGQCDPTSDVMSHGIAKCSDAGCHIASGRILLFVCLEHTRKNKYMCGNDRVHLAWSPYLLV